MDATADSFLSNLRSGDKLLRDFLSISSPDPLYPYLRPRVWRAETTTTEKKKEKGDVERKTLTANGGAKGRLESWSPKLAVAAMDRLSG